MTGEDAIITYETLYEILRREKFRTDLQKLDSSFLLDVAEYFKNKEAILKSQENKDSIFASREVEKTRTELKNIRRIINELYERRERKIIQLALLAVRGSICDTSAMLNSEKELFESLKEVLNRYKSSALSFVFGEMQIENVVLPVSIEQKPLKREEKIKEDNTANMRFVRFLCSLPEFVGPDLKSYGPFEEGSMAELPVGVVEMVVGNKSAELVEDNETSKKS